MSRRDPQPRHCPSFLMAAEHVATLQRIARVTPDQITPEVIADAKAASEAACECEKDYGHPPPHKSGDETWVDEDADDEGWLDHAG